MEPYRACHDLPVFIEPDTRRRDLRIHMLLGILIGVVATSLAPLWFALASMLLSRDPAPPTPSAPATSPAPATGYDTSSRDPMMEFDVLGKHGSAFLM